MARKRGKRYKSTRLSAVLAKQIILDHYEAGRHDKCKLAVYRNIIYKKTGISERTFWRYMAEIEGEQPAVEDKNQLKLDF